VKGVRECAVQADSTGPPVLPSADNVRSGSYPIARALYFYTRSEPEGSMKGFVDFALSEDGQKLVTEVGYYPVH
jgi:phosphate transport system substrate-binding protein